MFILDNEAPVINQAENLCGTTNQIAPLTAPGFTIPTATDNTGATDVSGLVFDLNADNSDSSIALAASKNFTYTVTDFEGLQDTCVISYEVIGQSNPTKPSSNKACFLFLDCYCGFIDTPAPIVTCRSAVVYTINVAVMQTLAVASISGDPATTNVPDVTLTLAPEVVTVRANHLARYTFEKLTYFVFYF